MKKANKVLDVFGELIAGICSRSPLAETRPLRWIIIVNPKAGGFTIKQRWNRHLGVLKKLAAQSAGIVPCDNAFPLETAKSQGSRFGLVATREEGHAERIAAATERPFSCV